MKYKIVPRKDVEKLEEQRKRLMTDIIDQLVEKTEFDEYEYLALFRDIDSSMFKITHKYSLEKRLWNHVKGFFKRLLRKLKLGE